MSAYDYGFDPGQRMAELRTSFTMGLAVKNPRSQAVVTGITDGPAYTWRDRIWRLASRYSEGMNEARRNA